MLNQGAAIVGLALLSLTGLVVVAHVMGDRIRRYGPPLACVVGLTGFAATRIVSLHQVDTLLYRRLILGARVASLVELILTLGLVVLAARVTRLVEPSEWRTFRDRSSV